MGLAEYALILALIAIVAIIALIFLGGQVSKILSTVGPRSRAPSVQTQEAAGRPAASRHSGPGDPSAATRSEGTRLIASQRPPGAAGSILANPGI